MTNEQRRELQAALDALAADHAYKNKIIILPADEGTAGELACR